MFYQQNFDWYAKDSPELVFSSVWATVTQIDSNSVWISSLNVRNARLYSSQDILGFAAFRYTTGNMGSTSALNGRITYNVVKSVIDSAQAKIAKTRPKPMFLTTGGNWAQQQKAKKLTQYVEGVFYKTSAYDLGKRAFVDAGVFGTGALKIINDGKQIKLERVFIDDIKVDYTDGLYQRPTQMHHVMYVTKAVLREMYPDEEEWINAARCDFDEAGDDSVVDVLKVVESWYLADEAQETVGKRAVCINNRTLLYEDYHKPYFPFVFMRWTNRLTGFWGQGAAELLTDIQVSINRTLRNIQSALDLIGVPRVLIEAGSGVATNQLNSLVGAILKYSGTRPEFVTATAMNAEAYNHLRWLIQSAYELIGVSQLSATSQKPAGLDSGIALSTYNDIETERFSIVAQGYEQMYIELANIIVDMSEDLYADNKELRVNTYDNKFLRSIKWSEVRLPKDTYTTKAYPISFLPQTPAGKMQRVQELMQAGLIPQDQALELLDFPDLQSYTDLATSSQNIIKQALYRMLDEGKYQPPEPEQNLKQAVFMAQQAYLEGAANQVAPRHLSLVLRYIDECKRLDTPPSAPGAPAAPSGPGQTAPAIAVPEAMPTSDLLPLAAGGV